MSPNQLFPSNNGALSPIAERVLKVPSLTYEVSKDALVIAVKSQLLVHTAAGEEPKLLTALEEVADRQGTLVGLARPQDHIERESDYQPRGDSPLGQVEIWRLKDDTRNSIDESRRLRALSQQPIVQSVHGREVLLPPVSPNHVAILSPAGGGCPAAPPEPAHEPREEFIGPPPERPGAKVTILDSGYIQIEPPNPRHEHLDARVTLVDGWYLDPNTGSWVPDRPDGLYTDPAGQLDGISGHGTFIAGLIAHIAPDAQLEVVGLRNQEVEIGDLDPADQLGLFETEAAIAYAMLRRCDTDVIQCGFAFPTLDDYPSLPFAAAMAELRSPSAPRNGKVAVVAPAGNERSPQPYWPAALHSVIGVASTDRDGDARADFSNWGEWCDCCARGEHVYSTFVYWDGSVEGDPPTDIDRFHGWARWDGTSFAAPKVSAEIARLVTENPGLAPIDAWERLRAGADDVVIDDMVAPHVPLPRIPDRAL